MKWFGILGFLLVLALSQKLQAQTATVTWGTTHQTMDGFGGETWPYLPTFDASQMNTWYSPTAGIGYQIIRTANWGCQINYSTSACPVETRSMPELATVAAAVTDGAVVELNIYPPANLKISGNFSTGTAGSNGSCVSASNYTALASFTVSWIQMMNSNGAPVTYLFPFNEPDQPNQLGGCAWTADSIDAYVKILGPALSSEGLGSIKIGIADAADWFDTDFVTTCLTDFACSPYISIVSGHGYGRSGSLDGYAPKTGYCCHAATAAPAAATGYHIWMDEVNGGFTYNTAAELWQWDNSMSDALVWARNIHDYLTIANVSAYNYWELADCCLGEPSTTVNFNDGLTEQNGTTLSSRYYVIGNWSKFIRSGWVRIDTTTNPQTGVYVTAFKDPAGTSYSIVAVNSNSSGTSQTFDFSGFPTTASVTPYTTTSSSAGLVEQPSVPVNNSAFTYTLPAFSVTSFSGSKASAKGPAPPVGLTTQVQ